MSFGALSINSVSKHDGPRIKKEEGPVNPATADESKRIVVYI